ncbi:FadR/GntR family transcriptional regulator [Tepidibacter hydrothermalis]|uniref:FadR/GntR family transcriptional regulator n=1 Tax=Tepidibacter hydrothermalis TaxID=3036126 RepID=A0ABY8EL95_9FIRM|nr:FadR/GntR family transcriptional regulator [Tepidibacter hydrothermalis]WFD12058.1 FadR/GntR family transcriptional regulator [Tepidibacter hydrothermalis]
MFTPVKSTKVYEHVINQIQEMVMDERLKKGDKLPPERELAELLGVSRTSIREALRALQVMGLIESKQGEGNFIRSNFDDTLFQPLSVIFKLQESKPEEILELRKMLEIETAALAAHKITDQEIEELKFIMNQLKECEDEDRKVRLDKEFHYKIADISKNSLIVNILSVISSLMDFFIKDARKIILSNEKNKEILIEHHEDIFNALSKKNATEASICMAKHMEFIYINCIN